MRHHLPYLSLVLLSGVLCACSPRPPKHGTAFLVAFGTNAVEMPAIEAQSLARAQEVMRKRLNTLGVRSSVEPTASGQLLIKVPRMRTNDLADVRRVLSQGGKLEFRMVHPESEKLLQQDLIEPGYEVLRLQQTRAAANPVLVPYLVKKKPERGLTGKYIRKAEVARSPLTNEPE